MLLPDTVRALLTSLESAGFSAYAVGGCVRDTLLGRTPNDWDICTSALPGEIASVFAADRVVETGLKHGTLTVVRSHIPYEITTYRIDGAYTDHRHPDSVSFVADVSEDLSRRDFTVNAMACDVRGNVVDLFSGRDDLQAGLIRCVGDARLRFSEDALRILRALRFASTYDFAVTPDTDAAIRQMYPDLKNVAAERIRAELLKLICGPGAGCVLRAYPEVFCRIIPELAPMIGYDQHNHHHRFDLWEHTVRALENVSPDETLRLTMLLHDTGKPATRTEDEDGECHYYGHPKLSAQIADGVCAALRCDRALRDRVVRLVGYHDIPLSTERPLLLRRLNRLGEADLRALFLIHRADRIATGTRDPRHADEHMRELTQALDALLAESPCYTLRTLDVNGHDLASLGITGRAVGNTLEALLRAVMDGKVENEKAALLQYVTKI